MFYFDASCGPDIIYHAFILESTGVTVNCGNVFDDVKNEWLTNIGTLGKDKLFVGALYSNDGKLVDQQAPQL